MHHRYLLSAILLGALTGPAMAQPTALFAAAAPNTLPGANAGLLYQGVALEQPESESGALYDGKHLLRAVSARIEQSLDALLPTAELPEISGVPRPAAPLSADSGE
ncbi:MAG: hypothetical protein R3228_08455 [Halioglobus sp.]|nr:hypothetical protein [Halioglobus sp.]